MSRMMIMCCVVAATASCVTIMKGSGTRVPLLSDPPGAKVTIVGAKDGKAISAETPTSVELRHGQDYTATFEKAGYERAAKKIESTYSGWFIPGNFLLGGIIGLIIDGAAGRVTTLSDDPVRVKLRAAEGAAAQPPVANVSKPTAANSDEAKTSSQR